MINYIWDIARSYAGLIDVVKLRPWTNVAFEKDWPNKGYSPSEAEAAWAERPGMNIGAIAWPHYWVLDLDGPGAVEFFEQLCRANGETRPVDELTLTVRTPGRGGGLHLWWQSIELDPQQDMAQHLPGCEQAEIKFGPARYTAVPPSTRFEGPYEFVQRVREPQPTPPWLVAITIRSAREAHDCSDVMDGLAELAEGEGRFAEAARVMIDSTVTRAVDSILTAPAGTRNKMVYIAAHKVCEVDAQHRLRELVSAAVRVGLDSDEAEKTVASAAARYKADAA